MGCTQQTRLTISGSTVAGSGSCGTGNLQNCGSRSSDITCCDERVIGPRRNRDNVRSQLHDYILKKLGAPVIEIELDEQQIDTAIDEAFDVWEAYAPREFYQYYVFSTVPGKSVYEMPPSVGYIRQVYYKESGTLASQANDLGGSLPVEYFYPGGTFAGDGSGTLGSTQPLWGRMGEWALYKGYEQMYANLSSQIGGWEFVGGYNTIKLYPIPCRPSKVIVHYLQKCKDWDCNYQAIREGALASAMMMVGHIRSKFQNIPGPQGGIVLNGQDMLQRGTDMWDKWEERLIYRYGDILPIFIG